MFCGALFSLIHGTFSLEMKVWLARLMKGVSVAFGNFAG